MKPLRFTLRFLLVAVTIAAVGAWLSRPYWSTRPMKEQDIALIEIGHTKWQVRNLLGAPHYIGKSSWGYDVEGTLDYQNITWEDDLVTRIERESWLPGAISSWSSENTLKR